MPEQQLPAVVVSVGMSMLSAFLLIAPVVSAAEETESPITEQQEQVELPFSVPASVISLQESMVSAEIAANIEHIAFDVGDKVNKGDELARLDCREFTIRQEQAQADLNSLKAGILGIKARVEAAKNDLAASQNTIHLLAAQTKVAQSNVVASNADFGRVKAQSQADQAKCHLANLDLQRARELRKKQVISQQDLDSAITQFKAAQAECSAIKPELDSVQAKTRSMQASVEAAKVAVQVQQAKARMALSQVKVAEAGLPALNAQIAAANAMLKTEQLMVSRCSLKAPFSGEIAQRIVQLGQRIGIGESAFQIVATGAKEVTASLSDTELVQLKEGGDIYFQTPDKRYAVKYRAAVAVVTGEARTREVRFRFGEKNDLAIGSSGRVIRELGDE